MLFAASCAVLSARLAGCVLPFRVVAEFDTGTGCLAGIADQSADLPRINQAPWCNPVPRSSRMTYLGVG